MSATSFDLTKPLSSQYLQNLKTLVHVTRFVNIGLMMAYSGRN